MSPLLPVYPLGGFGYFWGLLLGTLIGMAFGFVLERAGFGRARNLAAQFYLTDTRVLKVMFSAIVTALVGMALLSGLGVLDLSLVTVPETFLWPQLVGGLLLGAGFIVSGYCPGTAVVAAASGNLDGVVSLAGVLVGSLAFGVAYGPLEAFYRSGGMGVVRLHELLGVPVAVVAAGVVAMAVGAFLGGERLERIFARRAGEKPPESPSAVKGRVFGGFGLASALALATLLLPARPVPPSPREVASISATDLAQLLVERPESLWIVDLRAPAAITKGAVPRAMGLPPGDLEAAFVAGLPATRELVVYAGSDVEILPAGLARWPGRVSVLRGGWQAWQAAVLTAPAAPTPGNVTPELLAELVLRNALHSRFTGAAAAPVLTTVKPTTAVAPAAPKKGGGC